jgi:hypothetical protein
MVRETGEATERFLRSMAAGDAAAKRELEQAAAAALARESLPACSGSDCASLAALAHNLAAGAGGLNRQLQGLLAALRTAPGAAAGLAPSLARARARVCL